MILRDLIPLIEAPLFATQLNLASGSKAFYRNLRDHPLIQDLCKQLGNRDVAEALVGHLHDISVRPIDPRYENPLDAAMAAYLAALEDTHFEFAVAAASWVSKAKNCWWAAEASARLRPTEPIFLTWRPIHIVEIPARRGTAATATGVSEEPKATIKKGMQFNQEVCLIAAAG